MRILLTIAVILALATPTDSAAQRTSGSLGVGGQFGSPSGFSLNMYQASGMSVDLLAAWDLDNFLFINGHGIFERPISQNRNVRLQYGPGVYVGVRDRKAGDDETVVGLSASLGLAYIATTAPFEIYIRVTPRINIVPDTDGAIGGGLGLRYYF